MSLIETAAKFDKMSENGMIKKVTEKYLVDALSFGEAENRTFDRLKDYTSGELEVSATKKTRITEFMGDKESDRFYLAKVAFVTIDEKTAAEKRTVSQWLIGASDFAEAYKILKEEIGKSMADIEVQSLGETAIVEYIQYEPKQ